MKTSDNTYMHDGWRTRFLLVAALIVALAAMLAGPAGARTQPVVQDEYSNNGWYTGLEHRELASQPAVQTEYSNNGWYTGLEQTDLPPVPAASADDGGTWDETTFSLAAALAAVLLAGTVVATRTRHRRIAA
jgi:hypothetical protein